jgi:protein TonB
MASLLLHGAMLYAMSRLPEAPKQRASRVVEMKVTRKEPPPPPPPPPEEPIPPPQVVPKKVKVRTVKEIVKEAPPPPPPAAPPPPPRFAFSVDMSSTVEGGSVEVPAVDGGGNMFADPTKDAALPKGKATAPLIEPGEGAGGDDRYQITDEPKFLTPESERAPPYPDEAKAQELEGTVLLRVYVGEDGRVKKVKVLASLGGGCTEAAVRWARSRWSFEPARAGPEAVGMWITVPVRFVLER